MLPTLEEKEDCGSEAAKEQLHGYTASDWLLRSYLLIIYIIMPQARLRVIIKMHVDMNRTTSSNGHNG